MPLVQYSLKNSPMKRLGEICASKEFLGMEQETPLKAIKRKQDETVSIGKLREINVERLLEISKLQASLENMHRGILQKSTRIWDKAITSHNRKTGVRPVDSTTGDLVL